MVQPQVQSATQQDQLDAHWHRRDYYHDSLGDSVHWLYAAVAQGVRDRLCRGHVEDTVLGTGRGEPVFLNRVTKRSEVS